MGREHKTCVQVSGRCFCGDTTDSRPSGRTRVEQRRNAFQLNIGFDVIMTGTAQGWNPLPQEAVFPVAGCVQTGQMTSWVKLAAMTGLVVLNKFLST